MYGAALRVFIVFVTQLCFLVKILHYEMGSVYLLILSYSLLPVELYGNYSFFHFLQYFAMTQEETYPIIFQNCVNLPFFFYRRMKY